MSGENVDKQRGSNGKKLGGITGKGFKPGQSGNPKGRAKKEKYIPDILLKIGKEFTTKKVDELLLKFFPEIKDINMLEAVLRMVYIHALKGNAWALQFIAERTEGKVPDQIDVNFYDDIDKEKLRELTLEELRDLAYSDEKQN